MQMSKACGMPAMTYCAPVVGEAHLVAPLLSINHPLIIQIKQIGVAVPVVRLSSPVSFTMVNQLACVFCHKLVFPDVLLQARCVLLKTHIGCCNQSASVTSAYIRSSD